MSKKHLDSPNLSTARTNSDIALTDLFKLYQMGGRMTRSRKNPPQQPKMESRSRERNRTLLRYEGEPSLWEYLKGAKPGHE